MPDPDQRKWTTPDQPDTPHEATAQKVTPSSGRLAEAALRTCDARNKAWLCLVDEAGHDVAWPVSLDYLSESILNRNDLTGWRRGHVAVRQGFFEDYPDSRELASEIVGQAAFVGFDACAGVMGNKAAQSRVGVLDVAQVAGPVERVEAGRGQVWRIPDVMEPGGGFE
jgi:hypothetical protein